MENSAKGDVAVVGLGQMGRAMARRLVGAGFRVRAWNRTRPAPDAVPGVAICGSIREAATGAAYLITSLADDDAVRAVVLDDDGVLEVMEDRATHIGTSTISHGLARALAETHAARRRSFVAAPVLGRPEAAEAGQLWMILGGAPDAIASCQPLFAAMSRGQTILGEAPNAQLGKICANFVLASIIEILGEASALGEKGGIPPARLMELFSETLLGAPASKTYAARIGEGKYGEGGFRVPLGLKDVGLALAAGSALRVPLPVADVVRGHMLEAMARGRETWDWSVIAATAREAAGLKTGIG
jgi:3-hydroxyisobutyrate dehydrogenase-like beta-hydroxyacid dehydrogenase